MTAILIQHLQNPALYSHVIKYFRVIETHISYVILTGDYAYKIKKPLDMGFLDFSSLEKRQFYCQEELRLNQSFAPEIYVAVIPITGTAEQPLLNGNGEAIEYAIQMHEFPQKNLFSQMIAKNSLQQQDFIYLAQRLAEIHQRATIAESTVDYGTPEQLFFPVQQNFDQIRDLLKDVTKLAQLDKIEKWAQHAYQKLYTIFVERKVAGFIRECHGDCHLGNIVMYHDKPMIFDSIEFNPNLRWTDVMADVGFLVMDLQENQHADFANDFLNHYLTITGDYKGLQVLLFYQSYRAVVRAKIALFQLQQDQAEMVKQKLLANYQRSMALAESYLAQSQPQLIIMHGVAGSGKTTHALKLARHSHAIHLRSDVERKRVFTQIDYSVESMQKVYDHLASLTDILLSHDYSVIVDATFLLESQRKMFQQLAIKHHALFYIVVCEIDEQTRQQWLSQRADLQQDFSDADFAIAQQQLLQLQPLTTQELQFVKKI